MSLKEDAEYYSIDNGFVTIIIDKRTKRIINESDVLDAYGGRTPAFNNAISNARALVNERERMKASIEQTRRDNSIRADAEQKARREMMRANELVALKRYRKIEEIIGVAKQTTLIFILLLTVIIVCVAICYPTAPPTQAAASPTPKKQDTFYL